MAELISPKIERGGEEGAHHAPRLRVRGEEEAARGGRRVQASDPATRSRRSGSPSATMKEVIDYMKREMEERYGGAEEATDLVYKSLKRPDRAGRRSEEPRTARGSPSCPSTGRYSRLAYLKLLSDEYSVEFSRIRSELFHKYSWKTSDVQQALNDLVNRATSRRPSRGRST